MTPLERVAAVIGAARGRAGEYHGNLPHGFAPCKCEICRSVRALPTADDEAAGEQIAEWLYDYLADHHGHAAHWKGIVTNPLYVETVSGYRAQARAMLTVLTGRKGESS